MLQTLLLCSPLWAEQKNLFPIGNPPIARGDCIMDRSYRLKMEEKLSKNILTVEYVLNCAAKYENKINQLAYKEKQYRNAGYNNFKSQLNGLITYRKPFFEILMNGYHMSLDDIKDSLCKVKEKNIPTKQVCDHIREIIISGHYELE